MEVSSMFFKIVYYILFSICFIYSMYFSISGIIGLFKKSKLRDVKDKKINHFAIIIPARNEEKVISNLIDSLKNLDYPKEKFDFYVVPNNCTDKTKEIAEKSGAKVLECTVPTKTKGDVLKFVFSELQENKEIDAYVIFDADNVVDKNFLNAMNRTINSGYKVAEGFRDAKNPSDNWISGSYTIFYLFQNVFFNRSRMGFGASSSINGTGFMIKKELIDQDGFETYTLTEDVEFTGQCALKNEKIAFVEDAITYDEYPTYFNVSWKQRKRWSAGIIECMKRYSIKLFKNFFQTGSIVSLDMALVYLGPLMQVISFIALLMLILFRILGIELNDIFSWFFATGIIFFFVMFILGLLIEIFVLVYKKKSLKGMFSGIILFSIFLLSWIPINILCFIKKQTKWEEIKHDRNIKISDVK